MVLTVPGHSLSLRLLAVSTWALQDVARPWLIFVGNLYGLLEWCLPAGQQCEGADTT